MIEQIHQIVHKHSKSYSFSYLNNTIKITINDNTEGAIWEEMGSKQFAFKQENVIEVIL